MLLMAYLAISSFHFQHVTFQPFSTCAICLGCQGAPQVTGGGPGSFWIPQGIQNDQNEIPGVNFINQEVLVQRLLDLPI